MKDKPDLVFDQPTATGWQRTEIHGDQQLAGRHLHNARALLGALRSMYGVNQRIAAGEPGGFYHRWFEAPDGTRIHVMTNDGHDTVRIYAPAPSPVPAPQRRLAPLTIESIVVAGTFYDFSLYNEVPHRGAIWYGLNADPLLLPDLPGAPSVSVAALSADGETAVGAATTATHDSKAFRWSRQDGMQDLGELYRGRGQMQATGVSADGSVVVGLAGANDADRCAFIWEQGVGLARLPDAGTGVPANSRVCVSPDGRYAAGMVFVPDTVVNVRGVLWERGGDGSYTMTPLPEPPTSSSFEPADSSGDPPPLVPHRDKSIPASVTDDGVVGGSTEHHNAQWYLGHEGVPPFGPGHEAGFYVFLTDPHYFGSVFRYHSRTGDYELYQFDGSAAAAADDSGDLCGTIVDADVVMVRTDDPSGAYTINPTQTNARGLCWVTDGQGRQLVLAQEALANAISQDGRVVVGYTVVTPPGSAPGAWGAVSAGSRPVYWLDGQQGELRGAAENPALVGVATAVTLVRSGEVARIESPDGDIDN